jgi:hypothetical protein
MKYLNPLYFIRVAISKLMATEVCPKCHMVKLKGICGCPKK